MNPRTYQRANREFVREWEDVKKRCLRMTAEETDGVVGTDEKPYLGKVGIENCEGHSYQHQNCVHVNDFTDSGSLDSYADCVECDDVEENESDAIFASYSDQENVLSDDEDADEVDDYYDSEKSCNNPEEEHESDSFSNGRQIPLSLNEELLIFFIISNTSKNMMKYLLNLLIRHNVPVARSLHLLKKHGNLKNFDSMHQKLENNEKFAYISIAENIKYLIENSFIRNSSCLQLIFSVDGLPLFRSSRVNLWPILMSVKDCIYRRPLPVALFCGFGKPQLGSFLEKFCSELKHILPNGLAHRGITLSFKPPIIVADAPARSLITGTIGHTGFYGCMYCREKGVYHKDRVVFPNVRVENRTDSNYALGKENNQIRHSPLCAVVGVRSVVVPDPMHCIYLGIVKKLLHYYCGSVKGIQLPCRLKRQQ